MKISKIRNLWEKSINNNKANSSIDRKGTKIMYLKIVLIKYKGNLEI